MTNSRRETTDLQREIKKLLKEMGISQATAATYLYCELHDDDDDEKIRKFADSFRKRLNRSSTDAHSLERDLQILSEHRSAHNSAKFKPVYVPSPELDTDTRDRMRQISKDIDRSREEE